MITNLGELKAEIADWINREDIADKIPTFIQMAESRINADVRVRSRYVETTIEYPNVDLPDPFGPIPLPDNFREALTLTLNDSIVERVPPSTFYDKLKRTTSGVTNADVYSIFENAIHIDPWATEAGTDWTDITLKLRYYEQALLGTLASDPANDAQTSTLLTSFPHIYLFGSLVQVAVFLQENPMQAQYEAYYGEAMESLQKQHRRAQTTDLQAVSSVGANGIFDGRQARR